MPAHVLVPVDNSARSTEALAFACREYPDADITAIHVLDPGDFYSATGLEGGAFALNDDLRTQFEQRSDEILSDAAEDAASRGRDIETERVIGSVASSIVEYAEETDVDHIIIGSHGRTGVSRVLLGSVAEAVTRRSPVPVTIVR